MRNNMKWITLIIFGVLASMVNAVDISNDVNVSNMHIFTRIDGDLTSFIINGTDLIVSPVDDCWGELTCG